jgi:hypothetical protein
VCLDTICNLHGLRVGATRVVAAIFMGVLLCSFAQAAETRVYLLRGWFGVFSTGMDELAATLNAQGAKAEATGHLSWQGIVTKIVQAGAAGKAGPLALVGHSQGANNIIEMARLLQTHKISVDLLITLAPFMQGTVPSNVVRAMNYYQSPGWGAPLTVERGFQGKLSNFDVGSDLKITHITIDKSAKVQAEIVRAIMALSKEGSKQGGDTQAKEAAPPGGR